MFILPSVTTITTKFFATRHTSYQHEKTCHFIAYLIYKIIILINNHLTWRVISSNFNRAAFLSIYNFYLFVLHQQQYKMSKNHISSLSDPGSHKHILSTNRLSPHPKIAITHPCSMLVDYIIAPVWLGGLWELVEPDIVITGHYQYSTLNSRWIRSPNSQKYHKRCVHHFL